MWVAGVAASIEPSSSYLNRQLKVAGVASFTLFYITNVRVPLEVPVI